MTATERKELRERWLAVELDRIWLLAERGLRALQKAQIRPQPDHPTMAEVEGILAARRAARLGSKAAGKPVDEAELDRSAKQVEEQLDSLRKAAPVGRLIETLELRPLEVETLVVAMAPHVDPPLTDLFDVLRGNAGGRRGLDLALLALVLRLKRSERLALLDAVDPERPLLRWGLIQLVSADSMQAFGSMTHRAIRPRLQLLSLLCRGGPLDPRLSRCARMVEAEATLDDLHFDDAVKARLASVCEAAARFEQRGRTGIFPWLLLWGPVGAGKKTVAARVAAHAGKPMITFDPNAVDKGEFLDLLRRVRFEAVVRDALLYIGPLVPELEQGGARELTRRLDFHRGMLAIGVDAFEPPMLFADHPIQEIEIDIPSQPLRLAFWEANLPADRRDADVALGTIATGFKLTPGEIVSIAKESLTIAKSDNDRKVRHADVRSGIERRLRNELGELARRLTVTVEWSDLVLPEDDMARVQEFISRKKHGDKVYNAWGFGRRVGGYGKGLTALFSGPPGTGKTMLAQLIARSLDLDIYQVDLAQVLSKWVGETEKQLAKVFDQAERAHAVLLFDEADSLFAKRTEVKTSHDRYSNLVVNYLLQRLEQYDGVAILTTNKEAQLDEALQRRLSTHLHLEIPKLAERKRLWQTFIPEGAPVEPNLDFEELARQFELSGGYIKNAAVRAAFLAAARDVPISMSLLRLASALELEDMGRVIIRDHEIAPAPSGGSGPDIDFTDA